MKDAVASIMLGLGDSTSPNPESVKIVEEILLQQMSTILRRASEGAALFRTPVGNLTAEDLVYLFRRSPVKLHRLLCFVAGKERTKCLLKNVAVAPSPLLLSLLHYLNAVGIASYPLENDGEEFIDEIKAEREERLNNYSRLISADDYLKFSKARQIHFARTQEAKVAFNNWLIEEVKLKTGVDAGAMLILQYLAYETIAMLVDFAFVVRRDQRSSAALCIRQDAVLAHGIPGGEPASLVSVRDPLTPAEIREAYRRAMIKQSPVPYHNNNARLPASEIIIAI